jgi:general secretion pathway protein F
MPEYQYTARDLEGVLSEGVVDAATEAEAVSLISSKGLFPVKVDGSASKKSLRRVKRISAELTATTFSQLADLLSSGVPMLRALKLLREQTSHAGLKFVLGEVARRVQDGETPDEAMARFPHVFGEMTVSMIRAGTEGGFLEDALDQVSTFTEAQDDLRKRVVGALIYPCILLVVLVVVVTGLLVFAVPQFEPVFESLREAGQLPWLTRALLAISDRMIISLIVVFAIGTPLFIGFRVWSKTDQGRLKIDGIKLKLPMAGNLFESFAVSRFCSVLGTLLSNGVPILRSLEISADATGNKVLSNAIEAAGDNVSSGERLAEPLAASNCFPNDVLEMISIAEESNTLESVLQNIATRLEKKAWRKLDVVVRTLEPLMLVFLASAVLVIVLALMIPMFRMSQTI